MLGNKTVSNRWMTGGFRYLVVFTTYGSGMIIYDDYSFFSGVPRQRI